MMNIQNKQIKLQLLLIMVVLLISVRPAGGEAPNGRDRFELQGVQVGQALADVTVYDLKGTPHHLSELWANRPILLVTASLTCPIARRQLPAFEQIAATFGANVSPIVLYTLEAHPKGDPSPYADGREWVVPENEQEGILCRQPRTLEERLQRARELKALSGLTVPMFVDGMDDSAWRMLGGGPNMAFLIRSGGTVEAKQGWFNGQTLTQNLSANQMSS